MQNFVTVSKNWKNPKILTKVNLAADGGIELSLDLNDFLESLKIEIGSVAMTLTKSQFSDKFDLAAERVIRGVKEESVKIMTL